MLLQVFAAPEGVLFFQGVAVCHPCPALILGKVLKSAAGCGFWLYLPCSETEPKSGLSPPSSQFHPPCSVPVSGPGLFLLEREGSQIVTPFPPGPSSQRRSPGKYDSAVGFGPMRRFCCGSPVSNLDTIGQITIRMVICCPGRRPAQICACPLKRPNVWTFPTPNKYDTGVGFAA